MSFLKDEKERKYAYFHERKLCSGKLGGIQPTSFPLPFIETYFQRKRRRKEPVFYPQTSIQGGQGLQLQ